MKTKYIFTVLAIIISHSVYTQNEEDNKPKVQDLDFLVGTWEIEFDNYDTHNPEKGIWFREKGTVKCVYDMYYKGTPKFITCTGKLEATDGKYKGRVREFRESIRYGRFVNAFERVGIYSNWPGTGEDILFFYPKERKLELKGHLKVKEGLERYEDVYQFDEDYKSYIRTNVANFPDMPVPVYNLTFISRGKKIK